MYANKVSLGGVRQKSSSEAASWVKDFRTLLSFINLKDETWLIVENTVIQCFIYTDKAPQQPTYADAMVRYILRWTN